MHNIRPGDLVLTTSDTWPSRFIRWYTGGPWSHVGITVSPMHYVSALAFKGVCIKRLESANPRAFFRLKHATQEQLDGIVQFCLERVGSPYDYMQVLYVGYRLLVDTVSTRGSDPYPKRYMCSELVAEACARFGYSFGKYPDNVLPVQIARSLLVEPVGD